MRTTSGLLSSKHPHLVVESLCLTVMEKLECQVLLNYLIDDQAGILRLNTCFGISEELAGGLEHPDIFEDVSGSLAQVLAGNIQVTEHGDGDPARSLGVEVYAFLPLMDQEQIIGALAFGSRTKAKFTGEDVARMKAFAGHLSMAMQRVRLVEALERRVAERTEESQWRANQLQQLAAQMTQVEERERRRLSQVLHDSLQQMLVAAKYRLFSVRHKVQDEKVALKISEALAVIDEAIAESRSLTSELSPPVLYDNGLAAGLEWLGRETERKYGLPVDVELNQRVEPDDLTTKVFVFHAVRELILNAVKHAQPSCLKIGVSMEDEEHLQVAVQDDGKGFDTGDINRKQGAGGFGLFSIRERLDVIGGQLTVTSVPFEGTRAVILVPCKHPDLAEAGAGFMPDESPIAVFRSTGSVRVLLADDHPLLRKGIADVVMEHPDLSLIGEVGNGKEALEKALELRSDVVLMDINMPVMDGVEATRQIKQAMPGIRVIGLSLHEQNETAEKMKEAGASEYVSKTAAAEDLIAVILRQHALPSALSTALACVDCVGPYA